VHKTLAFECINSHIKTLDVHNVVEVIFPMQLNNVKIQQNEIHPVIYHYCQVLLTDKMWQAQGDDVCGNKRYQADCCTADLLLCKFLHQCTGAFVEILTNAIVNDHTCIQPVFVCTMCRYFR